MASIISALQDIVAGILNFIQAIISTIMSTISGTFSVAGSTVKEGTHATGNLIDLVLSNIIPIGVVIAALVGFSAYQQSRGRAVGGKTMGKKNI
ncbi:MAG: hypothetical protein GOMPHAMPRED_001493 [Gomphillus americanus]|uniref:Uncharacterized protein n=1 Tax=Gomphillus americanus TaxID=1940652 RepID=A0A8H3IGZ7_9LECA|nr:MAG: hypothetical protein GOMPHAMPRED_001493 [Gomphillus americanus]